MLVCHCRAVNDRRIREEIAAGARDTFDLAERCGAGSVCGGCVPVVCEILAQHGCAADCAVEALRRERGRRRPVDAGGGRP